MREEKLGSPGERRRGRRTKRKLAPFLAAAVLVWLFLDFAGNFLVAKTAGVEVLSMREVSPAVALDGLLIKEETLVRSPADGQIQFTPPDGQRLELGAPAARVAVALDDAGGITQGIAAPRAGVFCTHIDGAEGLLTPDKLDVLDLAFHDPQFFSSLSQRGPLRAPHFVLLNFTAGKANFPRLTVEIVGPHLEKNGIFPLLFDQRQ